LPSQHLKNQLAIKHYVEKDEPQPQKRLGGDFDLDARCDGRGLGDRLALLSEALDVDCDSFANKDSDFFLCLGGDTEARKVRSVGAPTAVFPSLVNDQVIAHDLKRTSAAKAVTHIKLLRHG
jgi:hypothetical protein